MGKAEEIANHIANQASVDQKYQMKTYLLTLNEIREARAEAFEEAAQRCELASRASSLSVTSSAYQSAAEMIRALAQGERGE